MFVGIEVEVVKDVFIYEFLYMQENFIGQVFVICNQ